MRLGRASKAPKGRLEGPLGGTLGPKVTAWTHIFAIRILVRFLSAKNRRCSAVKVGQGERLEAIVGPAEGGEASLSELCRGSLTIVQHALLPLSRGAADSR